MTWGYCNLRNLSGDFLSCPGGALRVLRLVVWRCSPALPFLISATSSSLQTIPRWEIIDCGAGSMWAEYCHVTDWSQVTDCRGEITQTTRTLSCCWSRLQRTEGFLFIKNNDDMRFIFGNSSWPGMMGWRWRVRLRPVEGTEKTFPTSEKFNHSCGFRADSAGLVKRTVSRSWYQDCALRLENKARPHGGKCQGGSELKDLILVTKKSHL